MALPSLAPRASRVTPSQLSALVEHVRGAQRLLCVTGAGISTPSGIPDYRSPNGSYSRGHKPMLHAEFTSSARAQQRYWARSFVAWRYFSRAAPNAAHLALAELERRGWLRGGLVTQNVDGLHEAAGQRRCVDLHGRIDRVECMRCRAVTARAAMQTRLLEANGALGERLSLLADSSELRADGDMQLADEEASAFVVPTCEACGGLLKPAVTFFGGSVDRERADMASAAVQEADALLVVGSSLQVYSAYRLARMASEQSIPIALLNTGPTRADALASLRIEADAAEVLPAVVSQLPSS
ncbi:hypothetical protein AB1Y20_015667 [Prymnesium parvum]|uniref:Deacetylase sirtuin-type domain-containing protein n=1 Tax=Prymnesium parvum TaxID=97485 RepID=A0AB34K139_PRYPA